MPQLLSLQSDGQQELPHKKGTFTGQSPTRSHEELQQNKDVWDADVQHPAPRLSQIY